MHRPIVATLIAALAVVGMPLRVDAATGHPGEPLGTVPLLRSGGGFGDVSIPGESTTPNGMVGAPSECDDPEGAAAYRIPLSEPARLRVTVTPLPGPLCAVGLYRLNAAGDTMTSLYDVGARGPYTHLEVPCGGGCEVDRWLGENTHFLVVWPQGPGAVSRSFSIAGTLRGFVSIAASLSGVKVGTCRRVDTGKTSRFAIRVSPVPDLLEVQVVRTSRWTGNVRNFGTVALDGSGAGEIVLPSGARGFHDIRVRFPGSVTREPAAVSRCLVARGNTKATIDPRKWRFQYDDYSVWRDGDIAVIRVTLGPGNRARGKLTMRLDRNIGVKKYRPFDVLKGIEVEQGLATFRMRAKHRSNGLPFYRIRAEWPGSHTYKPAKSPWICIQFNR